MTTVDGFENSGRWDRSPESLERNVKSTRRGRSFGGRTELTRKAHSEELSWPGDGWSHYHPRTEWGLANCAVEWERDTWRLIQQGWLQLTDFRPRTKKNNVLLAPSLLVYALLEHKQTGVEMELGAAHMNLHNTEARDRAWHEEADTLNKHYRRKHRLRPDRVLTFLADVNRTQRLRSNQELLARTIMPRTGMRNLWVGDLPPGNQGTHGRSVLDVCLTTAPGKIYLLPDDASSDHRPFGVTLRIKR